MNFFRNHEVVKILSLQIFISVSAIVVAFIWDQRFGVFTFIFTTLLFLISTVSTYMRYNDSLSNCQNRATPLAAGGGAQTCLGGVVLAI